MRGVVQERYGSVEALVLREVEPPPVADDEVLVRVRAASVHPDVWHVVSGRPYVLRAMGAGLVRPRESVPGTDLSGTVESVGAGVTSFVPGDEVYGECIRKNQWRNGGAYAELAAAPAASLELKPAALDFAQAAAVPTSALIALQGVRDQGRVQAGQQVLINGAGGGVGVFAVQLAKAYGATVTAVDVAAKLERLTELGADRVLDADSDFTRTGDRYDVIVDVPGGRSLTDLRRAMTPRARYVLIAHDGFGRSAGRVLGSIPRFAGLALQSPFVTQQMNPSMKPRTPQPLRHLTGLIEDGRLTPVVDRAFPLAEVREALRYLAGGAAFGKVVLTA